MQLPLCAFFAWFAILLFSLTPKRLSFVDFAVLYGITLIFTTSTYTVFDVDAHVVTIQRTAIVSYAAILCRVITIPLLIMMAVNALQTSKGMKPRWLMAVAIWMGLTTFDWALNFLKVITYHRAFLWHVRSTAISYFGFIVVAWAFTWLYIRFAGKNVRTA